MQVFKGKKKYEDFVRVIGNGMKSDTFEFDQGMPNEIGFKYLVSFDDSVIQNKVINTLKTVDSDMDDVPKEDGMYRKLSFFLKVGIIFGKYYDRVKDLSPLAISTLVTQSHFSLTDEGHYVALFSDEDMLLSIRSICNGMDINDIFLAVMQHYDMNPFDINDEQKLREFRSSEMSKYKDDREAFFENVICYKDLASIFIKKMEEGKKR